MLFAQRGSTPVSVAPPTAPTWPVAWVGSTMPAQFWEQIQISEEPESKSIGAGGLDGETDISVQYPRFWRETIVLIC